MMRKSCLCKYTVDLEHNIKAVFIRFTSLFYYAFYSAVGPYVSSFDSVCFVYAMEFYNMDKTACALTSFIYCAVIFGFASLPGNTHSPDFTTGAYFGCFRDIGTYATFKKQVIITKREPASCRDGCRNENFTYIGLWGGVNCWCAFNLNERTMPNASSYAALLEKVNDSQCNASCTGNSSLSCGGFTDEADNDIYSVYSVCQKTKYDKKTCKQSCNCKDGNHCNLEGVCPNNECAPGWKVNLINNRLICNTDVDECEMECNSTHNSNCHKCSSRSNERCNNTKGGYECICESGFHDASEECIDVDECKINKGGCQHFCNNTPGSFSCSCPPGFRNTSDSTNEETIYNCTDIDECSEGSSKCVHNCSNTIGNYRCSCHLGFQLQDDRFSCNVAEADFESSAFGLLIGMISACCVTVGLILLVVTIVMYNRHHRLSVNANQKSKAQSNYESVYKEQGIAVSNETYEELNLNDLSIQTAQQNSESSDKEQSIAGSNEVCMELNLNDRSIRRGR